MNKHAVVMIMVLLCTMTNVSWGQSYWKRTYGLESQDYNMGSINAISPTFDGNFIAVGSQIVKITPYGDTVWTKKPGEVAYAVSSTQDGSFIVAGSYIAKATLNGDILWTKSFAGTAFALASTPDGNFIVAGKIADAAYSDIYIQKINPNGDSVWTKRYKVTDRYTAEADGIAPTLDGNYIVIGGKLNIDILKINSHGDTLWTKTMNGNAHAIAPTGDGNFIIAGWKSLSWPGSLYLLKITQSGDIVWTKTYGVNSYYDIAYAISPTIDSNFIVAGYTAGEEYILKIKSNGDTLWTQTFGTGINFAKAIAPTSDGNFIVTGFTQSSDVGTNITMWFHFIINDRYAYKDSLFTFKIPISGDSLNHGYSPFKVPSGMTVSPGGTISWTPKTDSVYMDHVEFLVSDDFGGKDTLTFNIFVNSSYKPAAIKQSSRLAANSNHAFCFRQASSSLIKFTLPPGVSSVDIYNINGRCIQRLKPVGAQVLWNGISSAGSPVCAGRYFAKFTNGKTSRVGEFTVVR